MEVDISDNGRIITLLPAKKQQSLRLSDQVLEVLQRLAEETGMSRPEIVALAITHLAGTRRNGQPVYMDLPPEPPASHKRRRRVA